MDLALHPCPMLIMPLPARAESVLTDAQRARIEAQRRRAAEAEAAPVMSGLARAELQRRLAGRLARGETVTEALKRLRPPPARGAKRGKPWPRTHNSELKTLEEP